jgi:tetratricopeptide (TPR) repeat protein
MDEATAHLEQALTIHRHVGNRRGEGVTLGNLADLLQRRGDLDGATKRLEQAIAICDSSFPAAAGSGRGRLAVIRAKAGDLELARALLNRGEEQLRNVHALETGKLLCRRGEVEYMAGALAHAMEALTEAESIAGQLEVGEESSLGQAISDLRDRLN